MSGKSNMTDDYVKNEYPLYPYEPNKVLPMIVGGVFAIGLIAHLFIAGKRGAFRYWWMFILGLIFEVFGYAVRRISADNYHGTKNVGTFAMSATGIVLAPAFFAASMYSAYGRIIRYVGPENSPIKRVTRTFVCADILSIVIQAGGSGMFAGTDKAMIKLGKIMLVVGFIIQIVAFGSYSVISVVFYRRVKRNNIPTKPWNKAMYAIWVACVLIMIRSVFRCLEYVTSGHKDDGTTTGFLLTHESMLWLFESIPCILAVAVLSFGHPSFFIPRDPMATLQTLPTSTWKQGY